MIIKPLFFLLLVVFLPLEAQIENQRARVEPGAEFTFEALSFAGTDSAASRLDVFVSLPFEALSFIQKQDGYEASYEESIIIFDSSNALVREKLSFERVNVGSFSETTTPGRYNVTQRVISITPGLYTLKVTVRDSETRKSLTTTRQVSVRSVVNLPLAMSDLMLVSRVRTENGRRSIVPNASGNVLSSADGLHLFCEIYNTTDCDTLDLSYSIASGKVVLPPVLLTSTIATGWRTPIFVKVDISALSLGLHSITLSVAIRRSSPADICSQTTAARSFTMRWTGIPAAIRDLEAAINQLEYLVGTKTLDSIKNAPTPEEKKQKFLEFWSRRDPSPGFERNEAMEEYYGRVAYANKSFSNYSHEGWRSDRGMVFILFGAPSRVDRHPFDSDAKPYEFWYYDDLNYRFLFVDQTGFGDYRLDPSTPVWELQRRRR